MTVLNAGVISESIIINEPGVYHGNGHGTEIIMLDPTKPVLDIRCAGVTVREAVLAGDGNPRTAPLVSALYNGTKFQDIRFRDFWIGVNVGDPAHRPIVPRIVDCDFQNPLPLLGSGCILMQNFGGARIAGCTLCGPLSGTQPDWGIRVRCGDTLLISDTNVTLCGYALYVDTPGGGFLGALQVVNSLFDSGHINAAGQPCSSAFFSNQGTVANVRVSNTWFGYGLRYGLELAPYGGGTVELGQKNCQFVGNQLGTISVGPGVLFQP